MTTVGTSTFTVPAGITEIKVTCVGGGGGCAINTTASMTVVSMCGSGAGAGWIVKYISGLTPLSTISYTIGAAGIPTGS